MEINPLATLDEVEPEDIDSGPVVILNLLKFKNGDSLDTYLDYLAGVMKACGERSGIELVYGGELKEQIQGDIGNWDAILIVRYPTRRHVYEMFRSDEYQEFNPLAEAALDKRVLWSSEPVFPYKSSSVEFTGGEWARLLQGKL